MVKLFGLSLHVTGGKALYPIHRGQNPYIRQPNYTIGAFPVTIPSKRLLMSIKSRKQ
jgi:hypothetical protein